MATLSMSAAAALRAGRLVLTPDHHLTLAA